MLDKTTTVQQLREHVEKFIDEREWLQFHNPKDLSMALSIEASELMEKFLWIDSKKSFQEIENNKEEVEQELADVLMLVICFARIAKIDISGALARKLEHNTKKYPVDKAKGRFTKWNKL